MSAGDAVAVSTASILATVTLYGFFVAYYAFARLLQHAELDRYERLLHDLIPDLAVRVYQDLKPAELVQLLVHEKPGGTGLAYHSLSALELAALAKHYKESGTVFRRRVWLNVLVILASFATLTVVLANLLFLTNLISFEPWLAFLVALFLVGTLLMFTLVAGRNLVDALVQVYLNDHETKSIDRWLPVDDEQGFAESPAAPKEKGARP